MSHVKVGQVWQDKNVGRKHTVIEREDDGWRLSDPPFPYGGTFVISESWLMDDYVLVKDVEEAK